jgi:ATP-dependent DNA ligase
LPPPTSREIGGALGNSLSSAGKEGDGETVFRHACKLGFEGIVSKRLGSPYISGRSRAWLKFKTPAAPAVKREAEEEWGMNKRR